jgi:hypothetical protein
MFYRAFVRFFAVFCGARSLTAQRRLSGELDALENDFL